MLSPSQGISPGSLYKLDHSHECQFQHKTQKLQLWGQQGTGQSDTCPQLPFIYIGEPIWWALFRTNCLWQPFSSYLTLPPQFNLVFRCCQWSYWGMTSYSASKNTSDQELFLSRTFKPLQILKVFKKYCLKNFNALTTYYHNECIQKLHFFSVVFLQREETKDFFIILRVLYASARFSGKWLSIFIRATEQTWVWVWLLAGPPSAPPTGVWIRWKSQRNTKFQPANFNL